MTSRNRRLLIGIIIALAAIAVTPTFADAPDESQTVSTSANTVTTSTTTTTSTMPLPPTASCPMWWSLARVVGFTDEQMPTLDRIIYRESRCDATQLNASDPNGGSVGLTQVNRFWCLPSRYYPDGYLQSVGVLDDCDDLYEPEMNLRAALALVAYSRSVGLSDWHQWAWL